MNHFFSQRQILSAVGLVAGLSLLVTVDSVLFGASFLAVRFSQLSQPLLGVILGLAVWAIYILLLLCLGSSALGSTAELLLGGAITSLRQLLELVSQVLRSSPEQQSYIEQQQLVASFNEQLNILQSEIATLSSQLQLTETAASLQEMPAEPPVAISQPSLNHQGQKPEIAAIGTVSPGASDSTLKAAAISQAIAFTSAAQAIVSDSWKHVKGQVQQQVEAGAATLVSSLSDEVQSHAQQALKQLDLSDDSLRQLWDWARHSPGSVEGDRLSHRPTHDPKRPLPSQRQSLSDQSGSDNSVSIGIVFNEEEQRSPQVVQVNRDLQNYLKYTNLDKLDSRTLNHKLDELFSPWLAAVNAEDESNSGSSFSLLAFDSDAWEQVLQRRKGIEAAQINQYMAIIEQKLLSIAALANAPAEDEDGLVVGLKKKLHPLLEQLEVETLSLEDFKLLLMSLAEGKNTAEHLSQHFKLNQLDLSAIAPSTLFSHTVQRPKATAASQDTASETTAAEDSHNVKTEALHGIIEQVQELFAQLDGSLQQSISASSDFLPDTGHPLQYLRDRLPMLQDGLFSQLTELPEQTSEQVQAWIEETQTQFSKQIHQAQTALNDGLQAFQHQAMEQAEQVRHWAAMAAWWLFGLTLSSAMAASAAGYFAVTSPLLRSIPGG